MTVASIFADFWSNLVEHEEQGLFLVLAGFILSFAFIRMSTRIMRSPRISWWPGSVVSDSGVHLHHLVFGIVTMMISGALGFGAFGNSPYTEIFAFLFGIGAGLTIDEFALWVYLDDVYWAEEGRSSIDATVIAAAGMLLALLGFSPFDFDTSSAGEIAVSLLGILLVFALVAICFAKQRLLHGTIGFFVLPIAIYGAVRLGKPGSGWARRRYGERRPKKQTRSEARFPPDRRTERFKNAFRDIVGGKPSEGVAAARDEAIAATREASAEVRHRAEQVAHAADRSHRDKE
ncbi:MAG TPA: hypothetical protein VGO66_07120 [Solirubrobacterales bacterium]|jgi:hypothetical protein|nr:hypothetical protein [Solirubrobacterales bacterium]